MSIKKMKRKQWAQAQSDWVCGMQHQVVAISQFITEDRDYVGSDYRNRLIEGLENMSCLPRMEWPVSREKTMQLVRTGQRFAMALNNESSSQNSLLTLAKEVSEALKDFGDEMVLNQRNVTSRKSVNQKAVAGLSLLKTFAWFCGKENRSAIDCICGDLKKDVAKMRREKHREEFVQIVVLWHVCAQTIAPIVWDSFRRLLAAIFPVGTIIRKLIGL